MAEVLFYHLTSSTLEKTLPGLLERSLQREWKAVVRVADAARVAVLDTMLWTYNPSSFLPHGTEGAGFAEHQPIYLTSKSDNPNGAKILFLVDGARIDAAEVPSFDRVCLIFNGSEQGALEAARRDWMEVKNAGLTGKYWAQDAGRWVEKAST